MDIKCNFHSAFEALCHSDLDSDCQRRHRVIQLQKSEITILGGPTIVYSDDISRGTEIPCTAPPVHKQSNTAKTRICMLECQWSLNQICIWTSMSKVVAVTGCSGRIGHAATVELARQGHTVIGLDLVARRTFAGTRLVSVL